MKGKHQLAVAVPIFLSVALLQTALCLPVVTHKPVKVEEENEVKQVNVADDIEYSKYLQEVVNVLESDPVFREKLDKAEETDIRSGKIAQELEYVSHHIRSRLDELKRVELQRLRELATKQFELTNEIDRDHMKISEHLDHDNPHTFEINDLKKLIHKTSQDLAESDRRRREEFKQYELQKEFEKQEKLRSLDEEHKKVYEEELKQQQEKHDKHEKIHHPGSKAQLEEVWEKQDHMDGQQFDMKTFFMLHDLDGNNVWDENEVKVLFINELNKLYEQGVPEDDMKERAEEMERMREHVFKEADVNKDGLISYQEFVDQTKRDEFQKDPEWQTVDHQPQFTHEEYLEFERRRQEEIQRLIAEGKLPPHPNMPQGYYPGPDGQYQMHPNAIPPQQPYHHGGPPQGGYPQQVNHHPNQVYEHHPEQPQQVHGQVQSGQQSTAYSGQQQPPPPQQYQPPPHHPQQQQYQHPPPQQQQYQHPPPQYQQPQQPPQYHGGQHQPPQYQPQHPQGQVPAPGGQQQNIAPSPPHQPVHHQPPPPPPPAQQQPAAAPAPVPVAAKQPAAAIAKPAAAKPAANAHDPREQPKSTH